MEAVGVESGGKKLIVTTSNTWENIFGSVFLFHAICVTTTAHYSVFGKTIRRLMKTEQDRAILWKCFAT